MVDESFETSSSFYTFTSEEDYKNSQLLEIIVNSLLLPFLEVDWNRMVIAVKGLSSGEVGTELDSLLSYSRGVVDGVDLHRWVDTFDHIRHDLVGREFVERQKFDLLE